MYPPSEATLANTTRLPVSDAIKFSMAERVHRSTVFSGKLFRKIIYQKTMNIFLITSPSLPKLSLTRLYSSSLKDVRT